jgi:hypothetical protein
VEGEVAFAPASVTPVVGTDTVNPLPLIVIDLFTTTSLVTLMFSTMLIVSPFADAEIALRSSVSFVTVRTVAALADTAKVAPSIPAINAMSTITGGNDDFWVCRSKRFT